MFWVEPFSWYLDVKSKLGLKLITMFPLLGSASGWRWWWTTGCQPGGEPGQNLKITSFNAQILSTTDKEICNILNMNCTYCSSHWDSKSSQKIPGLISVKRWCIFSIFMILFKIKHDYPELWPELVLIGFEACDFSNTSDRKFYGILNLANQTNHNFFHKK